MYTQCPECSTIFRLAEEQLRAAGGKVRCGECHKVFNATEHLLDHLPGEPDAASATATAPTSEPPAPARPEPGAEAAATAEPAPSPPPAAGTGDGLPEIDLDELFGNIDATTEEEEPAPAQPEPAAAVDLAPLSGEEPPDPAIEPIAETPVPGTTAELFGEEHIESLLKGAADGDEAGTPEETTEALWPESEEEPDAFALPEMESAAGAVETDLGQLAIDATPDTVDEFDLPEPELTTAYAFTGREQTPAEPIPAVFTDDENMRRGSAFAAFAWLAGITLLLGLLAIQYLYLDRTTLVRYPQMRPWVELLCQYTACGLPPRRDLGAIALLERDIHSHPQYQGALAITASMVNRADFAQPYPDLAVEMRDVDGKVVASRLFHPDEYLVGASSKQPFAAHATAQLELDVVDPGPEAVGFEFTFY